MDTLVRSMIAADEELQVGLRSAAELANRTDLFAYESCLQKSVQAVERAESVLAAAIVQHRSSLSSLPPAEFVSIEKLFKVLDSDIVWKHELLFGIAIDASRDQLNALATLVKTRPFIGQLIQ
jgi:hypothetical protein